MEKTLGAVQETMLIPLSIKALETQRGNCRIVDEKAVEIISSLKIDPTNYDGFMSHEGVVSRTILFDDAVVNYIESHPDCTIVNLGCGLDARFERVDNGSILWYDLDLEDSISVREDYFKDSSRRHMIAGSMLEPDWVNKIEKRKHMLFIIEGVLMYFTASQVKQLLQILTANFQHGTLMAELSPGCMAKVSDIHDTVKKTNAKFNFGLDHGKYLEGFNQKIHFEKETSFNVIMKKYSIRAKIFATLPFIKNLNDRLAIYHW